MFGAFRNKCESLSMGSAAVATYMLDLEMKQKPLKKYKILS